MKTVRIFLLTLFILVGFQLQNSQAQSFKLVAADVFNGAATGLAAGGATMALQNSGDRAPLRVGLGIGILYGLGVGIYDASEASKGEQFYISGTFNDGRNSTVLVLLDTIYGAVLGSAVGSAVALIGNDSLADGLQYGAGAGGWVGLGFGLVDAFALAERPSDLRASAQKLPAPSAPTADGMIHINPNKNVSLGFLNPSISMQQHLNGRHLQAQPQFNMQMLNVNVQF